MKAFQSIRWRLQIWHGLLLAAVLAGFALAVYYQQSDRQVRGLDAELSRRIQALATSRRPMRDSPRPRQQLVISPETAALFDNPNDGGFYYAVWLHGSPGPVFSSSAPPDVTLPADDGSLSRVRGLLQEAYAIPAPGDCLLVGHSAGRDNADLRQLAGWLVIVVGGVLAVGLLGGAWLVHRALTPIRDISAAAQKIATGDLTQRIGGAGSHSELGQLVQVLNSTFARLDSAFTQQARFTADAAHELRTPVAVMLAQAQDGLTSPCDNPDHHEAFEASQRAAQRMRTLITSLLELARLDAGQEAPARQPCDLASIAADCIALIQPIATAHGITLHPQLAPAACHGDRGRLEQVITNLLANAIAYNHAGGDVTITTRSSQGLARLTVHNTGPGIAAEDLPRIFERFYRADQARNDGHSGLGLAITKAIVLSHGGTVQATSRPHEGTTFSVTLPGGA